MLRVKWPHPSGGISYETGFVLGGGIVVVVGSGVVVVLVVGVVSWM